MPRLEFRSPPVHEVIVSVQFQPRVDLRELDRAASLLSEPLLTPERLENQQLDLVGTPTGETSARLRREAMGWVFKNPGPTKVVLVARDAVSVHAVRPGRWPNGPYPGWDVIGPWALGVVRELTPIYAATTIRQAALRYLNRIAIPEKTDLAEWFTMAPKSPAGLLDVQAFSFGQTWDRVEDRPGLSAAVRLVKIAIDDAEVEKGNQGALLDIEILSRPSDAPSFDGLAPWFTSAHEVENEIFEACLTPRLSDTFKRG